MGQSQNPRTHVSVGFGVLFRCLKLVLAMEHTHTATICDFLFFYTLLQIVSFLIIYYATKNRHAFHRKIGTFSTSD